MIHLQHETHRCLIHMGTELMDIPLSSPSIWFNCFNNPDLQDQEAEPAQWGCLANRADVWTHSSPSPSPGLFWAALPLLLTAHQLPQSLPAAAAWGEQAFPPALRPAQTSSAGPPRRSRRVLIFGICLQGRYSCFLSVYSLTSVALRRPMT